MEKLLLIDGHSILNRAYYALPPMSNSEGIFTNAVVGFLSIMTKYIDMEKPDYFIAVFDEKGPTFRHEMFAEYKGTRKGADPEFRMQVPMIQELLSAMGIPVLKKAGLEADDILGTIAKKEAKNGLMVTLISGDRDLLQIADDNIKISIPKTKKGVTETEEYFKKDVIEKLGVTPLEYIDVKALMGDSSDNIPGVPGIGEKGAFAIIRDFKSIDEALKNIDSLPKRTQTPLKEHFDMAVMSKTLATIKIDSDIEYDLSNAKWENPYTKEARVLCEKWELKSFLKRFKEVEETEPKVSFGEDVKSYMFSLASEVFETLKLKDKEIISLVPFMDESLGKGIGIATDIGFGFLKTEEITEFLSEILDKSLAKIIVFDFKEMAEFFSDLEKVEVERFFDVKMARYLIDPTRNSYDLNSSTPGEKAYESLLAFKDLSLKLREIGSEDLFYDIEMPLSLVLKKMEKEGIFLDVKELSDFNEKLGKAILGFENEIYGECGEIFNLNSPKQLGEVLFGKMGIPGGKKTKSGYSTAADVLEKLAPDYPVIEKILLYRQYAKLKSTYAEGLAGCVAKDGRVHTTFQQTVTATGRLSSTNPNLQNIPIRTELGREIRKVFKARPGYTFVDADYSQIELRVLAHMSGDEHLIDAYKSGDDIHRATAAKVFNKPYEEVTDRDRSNAKAVNFGIVYGISSFGLGEDLNISRAQAKQYIEDYYKAYPTLKQYLDNLVAKAKTTGYAYTMFGRRRPIPELRASNFMQRSFGERVAMNTPIQGSAADIIKIAMIRVDKRLKNEGLDAKLILQVHDELIIEAKTEDEEKVKTLLKEEMEGAVNLLVPLISDVHSGADWYSAK